MYNKDYLRASLMRSQKQQKEYPMNENIQVDEISPTLLNQYMAPLLGAIDGFMVFIAGTMMIGGVYNRPNVKNGKTFRLDGLVEFIKAPFMILIIVS